jgi:protein-S-isoprenylcysteine O-methyltransferase Ste14
MLDLLFPVGAVAAVVLIGLLLATLVYRSLRIWPTPGAGSWQAYVFWPLFRGLNVLCFASAFNEAATPAAVPIWGRLSAVVALVASVFLFLYAFRKLGRDNSYGATDGLVTSGIYQWTRNPQNTMLIVVYGCLAVASGHLRPTMLCVAMMAVYALMVLCEEPWLLAAYGEPYRAYCRAVPRFFNWHRLRTGDNAGPA